MTAEGPMPEGESEGKATPGWHRLFSIAGKTALVTGGVRGIGLMIAQGYVEAGATVYITSRSLDVCEKVAAELSEGPGEGVCHAIPADLSSEEGCLALAETVKEREPKLDILVNNAGVMGEMWMGRLNSAIWREVLAVNVEATFYLVRELLPLLKAASSEGDPARVLNMGSISGHTTSDFAMYPYSASKAAVHHLTAHLARTLAPEVSVNALAPGYFETRLTETALKLYGPAITKGVPLRRIGEPDDLVGVSIFLASRAAAYVTGLVVPVDGGFATT